MTQKDRYTKDATEEEMSDGADFSRATGSKSVVEEELTRRMAYVALMMREAEQSLAKSDWPHMADQLQKMETAAGQCAWDAEILRSQSSNVRRQPSELASGAERALHGP